LVACNTPTTTKLTVATPDGAPTMAVSALMKYSNEYDGSVISSDDVNAQLTKGVVDFIIAPTNDGVKLALNNQKYKVLATTSWGNLYLVSNQNVKTLEECSSATEFLSQLNEQQIDSIGANQVPGLSLKYLLGLTTLNVGVNPADAALIKSGFTNGTTTFALLGEPAVTATVNSTPGLKRIACLSDIWLALVGTSFPQASVFVKSTISEDVVNKFLYDLEASINYLNASADNALELGTYMENRGDSTLKGNAVKASYLKMNQKFVLAKNCKQDIINFVTALGVEYTESTDNWVFYGN
jgi:NitT/TauT family transport system substrate-binding protein